MICESIIKRTKQLVGRPQPFIFVSLIIVQTTISVSYNNSTSLTPPKNKKALTTTTARRHLKIIYLHLIESNIAVKCFRNPSSLLSTLNMENNIVHNDDQVLTHTLEEEGSLPC